MKLRSSIILSSLAILLLPGVTFAAQDITGNAWAQVFGGMNMASGVTPYAVTIDDLSNTSCDNTLQTCQMAGLSWSDTIGWTVWDGQILASNITGGLANQLKAKATYKGMLSGFIWSEKTGWISLSACSGMNNVDCTAASSYCSWNSGFCEVDSKKVVPVVGSQDQNNWGAYIEFCPLKTTQPTCESVESDPYCNWAPADSECVFDSLTNPNGQPLKGFARSEKLGWLKFGLQPGDVQAGFTGTFTNWMPDLTVPKLKALSTNNAWIPNQSTIGAIFWPDFSTESNSNIDLIKSDITVAAINNGPAQDFANCLSGVDQGPGGQGDLFLTQANLAVDQDADGLTGDINLNIPLIGNIGEPPHGFCKYELSGVVYNGWGFGYYFGPDGLTKAASDWGVDPNNAAALAPNIYSSAPVTLNVIAGSYAPLQSTITPLTASVIADGADRFELEFDPNDPAGNPLIAVKADLNGNFLPIQASSPSWVRNIALLYDFEPQALGEAFYHDRISTNRNEVNSYPFPVRIGSYLGASELHGFVEPLTYPKDVSTTTPAHQASGYAMNAQGFAPTTVGGNQFNLHDITITTVEADLPPISPTVNLPAATIASIEASGAPYPFVFIPQIEVMAGSLSSDFITLGLPVTASYDVKNNSQSVTSTKFGLDHLFAFTNIGLGIGQEVLEFRNINLSGLADTDGRTDPTILGESTRYQVLSSGMAGSIDANAFHSSAANFHTPAYFFDDGGDTLDANAVYQVPGSYYAGPEEVGPFADKSIDRSDLLSFNLPDETQQSYSFAFTGDHYIGEQIGDVEFGIDQYVAYVAYGSPYSQSAIYEATKFIDGIEIKSIGIGTSGVVSGGQVFETVGGRDLQTVTTTSSADLRKEIRRNVAVLTRNLAPCTTANNPNTLPATGELPKTGSCVQEDVTNKTVIVYYSGPGTFTLGGTGNIVVPADYRYTIILDNDANLSIESNITYGVNSANSLGVILLSGNAANGANVYMSPTPTNVVGLLYAEGSLLGSPDAGATLYYGGGASADELKNQLFWQGSIASKNTIGGAPNKVVPPGANCSPWPDTASCAQAHDLDFLRRFTWVHYDNNSDDGIDYAPAGFTFSGGGSCAVPDPNTPNCTISGGLPTTVNLTGTSQSFNRSLSKSLDTVFIERDNRPVPPGFSSTGGLTSSQEIRN